MSKIRVIYHDGYNTVEKVYSDPVVDLDIDSLGTLHLLDDRDKTVAVYTSGIWKVAERGV